MVTELDALRRIADRARRLVERLDLDAAYGLLDPDRLPVEIHALRDALGLLEELDEAEAELDRLRAKWAGEAA